MKVKRKNIIVSVLVLKDQLTYALDGITILVAKKGDVINVPFWMATGLAAIDNVSFVEKQDEMDGEEEVDLDMIKPSSIQDSDEDDEDEEEDDEEEEEDPLKSMTEMDFAEMTVSEVLSWAKENLGLSLPKKTRHEDAVKIILEKIEAL